MLFVPPTPLDDAEYRRRRGEAVLERARQQAESWDNDEQFGAYRVPLARRNTTTGGDRSRETNYRNIRRRYPN
jgi:hypothetical protein